MPYVDRSLVSVQQSRPRELTRIDSFSALCSTGGCTWFCANAVSPSDAAVQVLGESAAPATVEDLILQANAQFTTAQERLREGDFAGYGELVDALQATLRDLARVGGIALPTPTPAAPAVDASAATTETGTPESGEAVDATPAP